MDQPAGGRTLMIVAVGLAAAALVIVGISAIVVVTRGGDDHVAAKPSPDPAKPAEARVAAADVVRLDRYSELVADRDGLRVRDPELAKRLGLGPDDVIVALSGRPVKREFDIHEVIFNTSMMNATTLYAELADGRLVRWKLDGDLRSARYALPTPPVPYPTIAAPPDPLLDTIVKVDDTHYTIPQATVDALLANPMNLAKGMRVVPAVKNGQPDGFKLYAIRPSSVFAHLGFANGDTVNKINGEDMTDAAKALDVYTKLRGAKEVTVALTRRGQPLTLAITVK